MSIRSICYETCKQSLAQRAQRKTTTSFFAILGEA
jgi:hypothetical protein